MFVVPVMVFRSMALGMILSVVAVAFASLTLLPAVLERWRTALACPVQLVRATSAQQLEMLRTGRIDIGFLRPPASAGSLGA